MNHRFESFDDIENYVQGAIGEGWPPDTARKVAIRVCDVAAKSGVRYGQNWKPILDRVLRGPASIEDILEGRE